MAALESSPEPATPITMLSQPGEASMTRDLETRADIAEMVRRFYRDVAMDNVLGPVFNDVARVDWAEHLPKLTAFWCRALLGETGYEGNPFEAHARINEQT